MLFPPSWLGAAGAGARAGDPAAASCPPLPGPCLSPAHPDRRAQRSRRVLRVVATRKDGFTYPGSGTHTYAPGDAQRRPHAPGDTHTQTLGKRDGHTHPDSRDTRAAASPHHSLPREEKAPTLPAHDVALVTSDILPSREFANVL
nr:ras-related protein Rab-9A isoform X2 [Loxodonta africana]